MNENLCADLILTKSLRETQCFYSRRDIDEGELVIKFDSTDVPKFTDFCLSLETVKELVMDIEEYMSKGSVRRYEGRELGYTFKSLSEERKHSGCLYCGEKKRDIRECADDKKKWVHIGTESFLVHQKCISDFKQCLVDIYDMDMLSKILVHKIK